MIENERQALFRNKAAKLLAILNHYAEFDRDAGVAFQHIESFIERVDRGEVSIPQKFPWGWIFFRGENNFFSYIDLMEAASDLKKTLEGR